MRSSFEHVSSSFRYSISCKAEILLDISRVYSNEATVLLKRLHKRINTTSYNVQLDNYDRILSDIFLRATLVSTNETNNQIILENYFIAYEDEILEMLCLMN
jgi:hypothetical protein